MNAFEQLVEELNKNMLYENIQMLKICDLYDTIKEQQDKLIANTCLLKKNN